MTDSTSGEVVELKRHSAVVNFLLRLVKEKPLGTVGGVITLLLLLTGIFSDFLAPFGVNETNRDFFLAPPSAQFWLGTDMLGRDVLSRVIFGARVSLIVGLAGTTIAITVALVIGMVCGYLGGKLDLILQRFVDAIMCFPLLILLMVIMTVVGAGMWNLIVVMGLRWGVTGSRILRGATIQVRENVYVQSAVAIGCPTSRIILRHILPNIMAPTIVRFTILLPQIILTESNLSFLGFGIPPPTPSWGGMLSGMGRVYMMRAPWTVIWPGLALAIVVYGVNMFGDAMRDILDPRLRGGAGRYGRRAPQG
ncbi:ABC transporter permease [Chloroflexota bacterium]